MAAGSPYYAPLCWRFGFTVETSPHPHFTHPDSPHQLQAPPFSKTPVGPPQTYGTGTGTIASVMIVSLAVALVAAMAGHEARLSQPPPRACLLT
jgi:hypothetical protein